jgi:hypothetical protein
VIVYRKAGRKAEAEDGHLLVMMPFWKRKHGVALSEGLWFRKYGRFMQYIFGSLRRLLRIGKRREEARKSGLYIRGRYFEEEQHHCFASVFLMFKKGTATAGKQLETR